MNKMLKAFSAITLLTIIGKILGFLREALIAAYFGTTNDADTFYVASVVPIIMFTAIGTAIQAGIIPIYMKDRINSIEHANEKFRILGSFFIWFSFAFSLLIFVFSEPLMAFLAPGFTVEQIKDGALLIKILAPNIILLTFISLSTGVLHSKKQFILPALSPVVQNIVMIFAIIFLSLHYGIVGLTMGIIVGTLVQFFIQFSSLREIGFRLETHLYKNKEVIKTTLTLFIPIIMASVIVQLNDIVDRIITSTLDTGSVAAINYAYRLIWLPISIILTPIVTIFYPSLVEKSTESIHNFREMIEKGIFLIVVVAIPFEIVILLESEALVRLAYERGIFDSTATTLTVYAFIGFAIALPFFALREFLMNVFYAKHQFRTSLIACIIGLSVNAIFSYLLAKFYGVGGVAFATSLSMVVTVLYLLFKAKQQDHFQAATHLKNILMIVAISIITSVFAYGVRQLITIEINHWLSLIITSSIVFCLYLLLLHVWKVPIWQNLIAEVKKKRDTK